MKNYDKFFSKLYTRHGSVSFPTTQKLLDKLGFKKDFKIFHVVGTNGKGSVSNYLAQGFQTNSKVGLFTSPHLVSLNERIQINNKNISNSDLFKYLNMIEKEGDNLPFFHLMYCAALLYFQDRKVDIAIIEAGIGGKLDVTNVVKGEYGTVTSISIDHQDILGNTLESIAKNKAGIMSKDMAFFLPEEVARKFPIFEEIAKIKKAKIILINNTDLHYQAENQKLVHEILKYLKISHTKFITPFGRSTVIRFKNISHIIDVAHNFDGIKSSLDFLAHSNIHYDSVIISMLTTKDWAKIKEIFQTDVFVYENNNPKAIKINEYHYGTPVENLQNFINDLDKPTLFIGSFYFINEVLEVFNA